MLPNVYHPNKNIFRETSFILNTIPTSSHKLEHQGKYSIFIKSKIFSKTRAFNNNQTNSCINSCISSSLTTTTNSFKSNILSQQQQPLHLKCISIISNNVDTQKMDEIFCKGKCMKCYERNKRRNCSIQNNGNQIVNMYIKEDKKEKNLEIKTMKTVCGVTNGFLSEKIVKRNKRLKLKLKQENIKERTLTEVTKKKKLIADRFYSLLKFNQLIRNKNKIQVKQSSILKAITILSEKNCKYNNNNKL